MGTSVMSGTVIRWRMPFITNVKETVMGSLPVGSIAEAVMAKCRM